MRFPRVIPTVTVAAACAFGAVPIASANAAEVQQASSSNWAGYVVGGSSESGDSHTYKSVTGSWTQPSAKCSSSTGHTYSVFWVGLGGAGSSSSLEQAGTEADCTAAGSATYHAWYELVPSAPVTLDLAIHAGDRITATTTVKGHEVTNTVVDHTTGHSDSKTVRMTSPDTSSAEWIAEAPSACQSTVSDCTPLPLTNFSTVRFTGATATDTSGHTGSISDARWSASAVTLSPSASLAGVGYYPSYGVEGTTTTAGSGGATPSSLSSSGDAFSVAYAKDAATTSAPAGGDGYGAGGGYGYGGTGYGYGYYGTGYGGYGYGSYGY